MDGYIELFLTVFLELVDARLELMNLLVIDLLLLLQLLNLDLVFERPHLIEVLRFRLASEDGVLCAVAFDLFLPEQVGAEVNACHGHLPVAFLALLLMTERFLQLDEHREDLAGQHLSVVLHPHSFAEFCELLRSDHFLAVANLVE